ncbi:carboxymethylenebutenolidase [Sphingomonas guangdongensis]|uniref:Carboxymethylenebutenolidase n=1 Tax=Sphingomonas guangdongensis TaxID=1141890 RepID=A0A285QG85_9SPHN|nr:dienelactone hydrolase family protein [Sphingomonas guangdongensis]SOB80439.1 carboxymethylenebutenolidase [Sphingomonas guangdongensis]
MTDMIDTLDGTGSFAGYVARPAGTPMAAIVVIQEIFGVNPGIRQKCDKLADAGYLAVAPDLFWRIEPDIQLDPDVPEQMQRALGLIGQFDQDAAIRDIEATIRFARAASGGAKVGCVGYCLGGRLAYMTAARTDVDASVGYYPVGIPDLLREAQAIAHPLLLHVAGADHFVDAATQAAMHDGLDDHPKVAIIDYPGEDHGFATEVGTRRSPEAAERADAATAAFFREHLA